MTDSKTEPLCQITAPYEYEPPAVWQRRYQVINEGLAEAVVPEEKHELIERVKALQASGIGEMMFSRGLEAKERMPRIAYNHFVDAANAHYTPAIFEIVLRTVTADDLFMSEEEFESKFEEWTEFADGLRWNELESGLLTGTRPVMWQETAGIPDAMNARMGGGSLFMVEYQGHQFAVTAQHVVHNVGANTEHFRLLLPDTKQILPVFRPIVPLEDNPNYGEHEGDIIAWQIDVDGYKEQAQWWSWRLDRYVRPASDLAPGQKLFAVGFPEFEENIDVENFDLAEHPFIATGRLSDNKLLDGLYTMVFDEHLPNVDLNGMSGGPVFARFDEYFHYVGLMIRSNGTRMNFISAEHVIELFGQVLEGSKHRQSANPVDATSHCSKCGKPLANHQQ